jgi:glucan phosphoethanolaminetransferase (alkaline phosphatase superfamily)
VIVGGIGLFLYTSSRRQDTLKNKEANHAITRRLQMLSPIFLGLTALTTTFMSIDWIMSLDYHWFSTMFGIIYFAGGFMSCHAVLAIVAVSLDNGNYLGGAISTEHRHAVGKMMWGLMVFWAYVSFCQFMLIWYANIPEETLWYAHRWENGWSVWSLVLLIGHFILPFFAMMSRHVKRNPKLLLLGALYLLAMHYVDMFWQIKPNMHHGHASPALGPVEILAFVGIGGVVLAAYTALLSSAPLVPVGDPRLPESLAFEEQ